MMSCHAQDNSDCQLATVFTRVNSTDSITGHLSAYCYLIMHMIFVVLFAYEHNCLGTLINQTPCDET